MESPLDDGTWACAWTLRKIHGDDPTAEPYEVIHVEGNLLMNGGVSNIWEYVKGNGNTTPGDTLCYFDNTNAYLGVGDSTTAATATQTDLQASSNKVRVAMDATYPTHTDGTTSASESITYQSTFDTTHGNFAWQEFALFNASASGRMMNRKVQSLGTKTNADTWILNCVITIS